MITRSRFAALLLSASVGVALLACSGSSPEENASSSAEELRLGHACPPSCGAGFHCGTPCDTCAVRTMVPPRACDPIPNYFECVPDVCPAPEPAN
ncbi:MAG TPA: hypothetical protein VGI39_40230 [Polyangiaceae bacterium]|jgi:hypothetical protein